MAFLSRETGEFDALTAEAQRAIDLLQERRTALISAAVTGQIDVRDFGSRGAAEARRNFPADEGCVPSSASPRLRANP